MLEDESEKHPSSVSFNAILWKDLKLVAPKIASAHLGERWVQLGKKRVFVGVRNPHDLRLKKFVIYTQASALYPHTQDEEIILTPSGWNVLMSYQVLMDPDTICGHPASIDTIGVIETFLKKRCITSVMGSSTLEILNSTISPEEINELFNPL